MNDQQLTGRLIRALSQSDIKSQRKPRTLKTGKEYFKDKRVGIGFFRKENNVQK